MQHAREIGRKWLLIFVTCGLGALTLGFTVTVASTGGFGLGTVASDRVEFHYSDGTLGKIPLDATEAAEAGWDGSIRCRIGLGRVYMKTTEDGVYPLLLLYGREDQLIAIRMFSRVNQPASLWQHMPDGIINTIVPNMEFEQWITGFYLIDPVRACGIVSRETCVPYAGAT